MFPVMSNINKDIIVVDIIIKINKLFSDSNYD